MWKSGRPVNLPLFLLACTLVLAGTECCGSASKPVEAEAAAPAKPSLTPTGPELVLQPGAAQTLHSTSPGATRFEWALEGEGKLAPGDGDTVLYTAPDHGGAMALVTVVAHNKEGASPQSSISISTAATPPAVSLASIGIPAGWMADGDSTAAISLSTGSSGCHTGADCIQITYRAVGEWAGIVWWPKACGPNGAPASWQRARACSCSTDVLRAGNLHSIGKVSFWARGESGREVVEFKVGDDTLCPLPGRSSGDLTLTADWRRYEIDLGGLDMRRAAALFTWVATKLHNPKGATFYLDDVQFEGAR